MREQLIVKKQPSLKKADMDEPIGFPAKLAIPLPEGKAQVDEKTYRTTARVRRKILNVLNSGMYSGSNLGEEAPYIHAGLTYINENGAYVKVESNQEYTTAIFDGRFCPEATKRDAVEYVKTLLNAYPGPKIPVNIFWLNQMMLFSRENGKWFYVLGATNPTSTIKCYIHHIEMDDFFYPSEIIPDWICDIQRPRHGSSVPHKCPDTIFVDRNTFLKTLKRKFGISEAMLRE